MTSVSGDAERTGTREKPGLAPEGAGTVRDVSGGRRGRAFLASAAAAVETGSPRRFRCQSLRAYARPP
jgi:hypothetical protein